MILENKKEENKINSKVLIDRFNLEIINDYADLKYLDITSPAIKRVGLELTQQIVNPLLGRNVICWGTSESYWFNSIGENKTYKALKAIFKYNPPLIILSRGVDEVAKEWIVNAASEYNIPVSHEKTKSTASITTTIGTFLNNHFLDEIQIHGCLVLVGGVGVLIIGPSGSGKSEATLDLIQRGHVFISDDAVLIKHIGDGFVGYAPKITKNFLEVRGIGIIDIKYTYGITSIARNCEINLVVELVQKNRQDELDRLGVDFLKFEILDGYIKKMQIPVKDGGSTASLIEAAVSTYLARHDGLDVITEIEKRSYK